MFFSPSFKFLQIFLHVFNYLPCENSFFCFCCFQSLFQRIKRGKMQKVLAIVCFSSVLGLSMAQFPNGRILEPPVPALCANRVIHERAPDGKGYSTRFFYPTFSKFYSFWAFFSRRRYFFSWRDPALKGVEDDWLGARNYCRKMCMDSVSLETSNENEWIKSRMVNEKVHIYYYTLFARFFSMLFIML